MAGKIRRKGRPYNPALAEYQRQQDAEADAKKRDRKATDLLRNARVAAMEVDDPMSGDKIVILRSTRDDPLADHHARGHIDEAQYQAGRRFQQDFERAGSGQKAIEIKVYVDGGQGFDPLSESRLRASDSLRVAYEKLGPDGCAIVHDVLVHARTAKQMAASRGFSGKEWESYFSKRLYVCLDCLAVVYGFAMRRG